MQVVDAMVVVGHASENGNGRSVMELLWWWCTAGSENESGRSGVGSENGSESESVGCCCCYFVRVVRHSDDRLFHLLFLLHGYLFLLLFLFLFLFLFRRRSLFLLSRERGV